MPTDVEILKPLVERIAALADRPEEADRKRLWADHQALRPTGKIPVCVYYEGIPAGTWRTILGSDSLCCQDPLARSIERDLRKRVWMADNVPDDHIVWPAVFVPAAVTRDCDWGVPLERTRVGDELTAWKEVPPLADGLDLDRVRFTDQQIDEAATARHVQRASELTGGRLAVHVQYPTLGYAVFDLAVAMRGGEQVMLDAAERPDELAALMEKLTDAFAAHHENRQRRGHVNRHLSPDGRYQIWPMRVNCCYPRRERKRSPAEVFAIGNGQLAGAPGAPAAEADCPSLADEWAYITAQTSAGLGPAMFERLVHPFNARLAEYFTRTTVYYHGCECLDGKLGSLARLPHLRRFHVSPWSSVSRAAATFGGRVVLEVHAHPGKVFFGGTPESMRAEIRELVAQSDGAPMDLNLSDIHSVNCEPATLGLWARIAQELAAR